MRGTSYEGVPIATPTGGGRKRVALVIGNSKYPNAPLRNPRNDAQAFGAKLERVEPAFDVTTALDVGRDDMEDALETFEAKLADCDTGLLFFAGHGLQVKGTNFLMPIDADIRQEIHLRRRAFSLDEVLDIMGRRVKHSSLVFLDACRENPFARSLLAGMPQEERGRFLTRSGLAEVQAGTGSFIAFATAPNNVALDGTSENSPFTASLLEHMATPNASINDVMIAVRRDVLKATGGRQEPWDQSSLRERFCFSEQTIPETAQSPRISVEFPRETPIPFDQTTLLERAAIEYWEAIKGSSDPAQFRAFLADYGTTRMAPLARAAMQRFATSAWRKLPKRDEAALQRFIADFAGTLEVAEAGGALAALQAKADVKPSPPPHAAFTQWREPGLQAPAAAMAVSVFALMALAVFLAKDYRNPEASDKDIVFAGLLITVVVLIATGLRHGVAKGYEAAFYWVLISAVALLFHGVVFVMTYSAAVGAAILAAWYVAKQRAGVPHFPNTPVDSEITPVSSWLSPFRTYWPLLNAWIAVSLMWLVAASVRVFPLVPSEKAYEFTAGELAFLITPTAISVVLFVLLYARMVLSKLLLTLLAWGLAPFVFTVVVSVGDWLAVRPGESTRLAIMTSAAVAGLLFAGVVANRVRKGPN